MTEISAAVEQKLKQMISEKVDKIASEIKEYILYDASVEDIDLGDIEVEVSKDDDEHYSVSIDLSNLNDYYKQLVQDIYYRNALSRRK